MKVKLTLFAVCALGITSSASSQTLDCKSDIPCPTLQSLLGTCGSQPSAEIICRTEIKHIASNGRPSMTASAYYEPPTGYVFDPATVRGVVSEGHGLHGVDASLAADRRLYCLWGTGLGGSETGYCEAKARQITSQK
jgi:hypothetical protein